MDWQRSTIYEWRQELTGTVQAPLNQTRPVWNLYIQGPAGLVLADDMGEYTGAADSIIEMAYWDIVHTLDGHYHCCLTGKCWYLT